MRKKVKKVIKGLEKASKTHAKQAKILKSGLKGFKARGGMDASKADFSTPSGTPGASKGPAGGASSGGNYGGGGGNRGGNGGNRPTSGPPKRKIGGPDTTKDVPYKSNTLVNLIAGAALPGGGLLAEGAQRKAYKDRQKFARKEGLYREYYIGNQFKTDPAARVLKPNSPEGQAFIKEAKPMKKPELGGTDRGPVARCPDGTLPPCKLDIAKPSLPIGKQTFAPKTFEFNFNEGGLVRGSGKILKDRNRKVRIF